MSEHENTNIYVQDTPSVWSKLRDELRENIVNTVVPEGVSEDKYLKEIVYEGLSEKIPAAPPIYIQRLDHELAKIREYGYTDVFLFLWDVIKYIKQENFWIMPGYGSITSCLVSYCIGLSEIDPLQYDLVFERFSSKSMEIYFGCVVMLELGGNKLCRDYLEKRYGEYPILVMLVNLEIFFRESQYLSVMKETINKVLKSIGKTIEISSIDYTDKAVYDNTCKSRDVYSLEKRYNRVFLNLQHPGSIEELSARVSLNRPGLETFAAEYIKNMNNPQDIIYECPQLEPIIGSTYGVILYQEQIMHILSCLAGFSMEQSDRLRREMGKRKLHATKEGKRAFIYGNGEDNIAGCIANGISEEVALKVFDYMYKAAGYAFNKSHAVACAVMAYRMSWLRCYYPEEFCEAEEEIKAQETKRKQKNIGG